ncbi:hypothetical protein QFZ37_002487 [Chryseobacterium ginsenosidimutans]|nr:hypothetical protein [Chryseobacterium ginsenosidimutans]
MLESLDIKKDNLQITLLQLKPKKNGKLPKSHRSTNYLCCVPTLEDSQELVV